MNGGLTTNIFNRAGDCVFAQQPFNEKQIGSKARKKGKREVDCLLKVMFALACSFHIDFASETTPGLSACRDFDSMEQRLLVKGGGAI